MLLADISLSFQPCAELHSPPGTLGRNGGEERDGEGKEKMKQVSVLHRKAIGHIHYNPHVHRKTMLINHRRYDILLCPAHRTTSP